jgi:hypothetical protein
MCEAILCGVAVSFSGECRTCAAMRGPESFGSARSPGSSNHQVPHPVSAAIRSHQWRICLESCPRTFKKIDELKWHERTAKFAEWAKRLLR